LDSQDLRKEFRRVYEKYIGPAHQMGSSYERLLEELACNAVIEEKGTNKNKKTVGVLVSESNFLYALREARILQTIWQEMIGAEKTG